MFPALAKEIPETADELFGEVVSNTRDPSFIHPIMPAVCFSKILILIDRISYSEFSSAGITLHADNNIKTIPSRSATNR